MRTNTNSCGILTFAIQFYLSVGLDERRHIGENYRKLAIPAGLCRGSGKKEGPPLSAGRFASGIGFLTSLENKFVGHARSSWYELASALLELDGPMRPRVDLRQIPGVTPWIRLKERLSAD